jgi:methanogenic corrinoid protein MtbC1
MPEPIPPSAPREALPGADTPGGIATPEFIASLLVDGDDDLAAWAIGQALEERSRSEVFDDVVRRAMELIGARWESGRWSISQEHLASVSLAAALARLRPRDAYGTRIGPVAVLAAPAGELHVAGLLCLAQILEDHGWHAENLGANVPADDLLRFVSERKVDLVALSIGTAATLPSLRETIEVLRAGRPDEPSLPIMVGGRGVAGFEATLTGVDHVSSTLSEAEAFIAGLRPAGDPLGS